MSSSIPADVAQTLGVTVGQRLGSGAYKTVYLGVYTSTGEEVAVSAEPCGESQETESEAMFRITSEPPHPHIIGPPAGQATVPRLVAHGHVYTVQVRCQCELFDVLTDHGGCVPEQTMRGFFLQAVAGLRFMHQNGVAHRDIKLENMLLTHDGRLKLIDFGLAHVAPMPTPIHGDYAMTSSVKVGTRSYEAPEVGRGVPYDAALADVWSLACTFFALAAGFFIVDVAQTSDPRFRALSSAQSAGRSTVRAIFQLYNRPCPLSAPLVRLLDGMLMVDPTRRLTLDQVVASPWLSEQYAPLLAEEPKYRTPLLNRRRAAARWARLTNATLGFGRAIGAFRETLEEVMFRPGGSGAQAAQQNFYEDADMLDAMAPVPAVARSSSGGLGFGLPALPSFMRSTSWQSDAADGYDDDEMGPPVWRSTTLDANDVQGLDVLGLGGAISGLVDAIAPVQPPPILRQKANNGLAESKSFF